MSLHDEVETALQQLAGWSGETPQTLEAGADSATHLELDLLTVDRLACSWKRLAIATPPHAPWTESQMRAHGQALCRRIGYLLEPLQVLECDAAAGTLQIRSQLPKQPGTTVRYYELTLEQTGRLEMRRFAAVRGEPGRSAEDIVTTGETLRKLIPDLVDCLEH